MQKTFNVITYDILLINAISFFLSLINLKNMPLDIPDILITLVLGRL